MARLLNEAKLATLLIDLLTVDEDVVGAVVSREVPAETPNSKLISSGSFEERYVVTSHAADAESDGNELPTLTSSVI